MQNVSAVQAKNMGLAAGEMRFVLAAPGRRRESAVLNNSDIYGSIVCERSTIIISCWINKNIKEVNLDEYT